MAADGDPQPLLLIDEDEGRRSRLAAALEPDFRVVSVAAPELAPEAPFAVRVLSAAALDEELEDLRAELEQQRRLAAEANRSLKRRQQELSAANTRLEEANERLQRFASTDALTGLYNHRYFHVTWRREVTRARRYGEQLCVMVLDVDHFEGLNERHGHADGDVALREVAEILLRSVRSVDIVARYGGDAFVVSLPRTSRDAAMMLAERLRHWVEEHDFKHGATQPSGRLTVSVGVSAFPDDGDTAAQIIGRAGEALAQAKAAGRNLVRGVGDGDGFEAIDDVLKRDTTGEFEALVAGSGEPETE